MTLNFKFIVAEKQDGHNLLRSKRIEMASNNENWSKNVKEYNTFMCITEYFSDAAAEIMNSTIKNDESVTFLEVAAGPGILALDFMKRLSHHQLTLSRFIITDFAAGMMEQAKTNIEPFEELAEAQKQFLVMDAESMETIAEGSVTHLGCMFGIMFFPHRPQGLHEMYRVLCTGGVAVIGTWHEAETVTVIYDFVNYLGLPSDRVSAAAGAGAGALTTSQKIAEAAPTLAEIVAVCSNTVTFKQELLDVGFTNVEIVQREGVFIIPNTIDILRFETNVMKNVFGSRTAEELLPLWEEFLLAKGEKWLSPTGDIRLHLTANLAIAYK